MELMTKAIEVALEKASKTSEVINDVKNAPIVVKYFNPTGAQTWYIIDGAIVDDCGTPDWELFGWCDLGFGPGCSELGNVSLKGPLGTWHRTRPSL